MTTVAELIAAANAKLLAAAKAKVMVAANALIEQTPVKTGRTRCSFVASIGEPPKGTDPKHGGAAGGVDPSGQPALDQIGSVVENLKPGDVLYLGSDYAVARWLNDGTRTIKPHHMVQQAALVMKS